MNSIIWEDRIRFVLCCGGGSEELFKELGVVSASVFSGTSLTPSDVATGMILVHRTDRANDDLGSLQICIFLCCDSFVHSHRESRLEFP